MAAATSGLKTAVITGGSDGIGAALATHLLQTKQWRVCLIARTRSKMENILRKCGVDKEDKKHKIVSVDLSKPEVAANLCQDINVWCEDRLDLLVNNAAISGRKSLASMTLEAWTNVFNVNVTMAMLLTQNLRHSLKAAQGAVVNIGSIYGGNMMVPASTAYSVSKCALAALTKLNAFEMAEYKVRVNCVQPGYVWTNFGRDIPRAEVENFFTKFAPSVTPLGRIGTTKDIVDVIMFLGDKEKSSWITGQCITVDGGTSMINAVSKL